MIRISTCTLTMLALFLGAPVVASLPALGNPAKNSAHDARQKATEIKGLKRATFQVRHASCVSCLRDIERRIRLSAGVKDVEVGIRPPYNSVVIYDMNETSLDTAFAPIRKLGYDFVNVSEIPASGKNAIIVRKEQKPAPAVDTLLGGQ